jgi:hypothetical protein
VSSFHRYAVHQVGVERPSQLSRRTAYARDICASIAVRASGLFICVGRICVPSADGAYALALLAIGAFGESVSLSGKDHTWEVMPQKNNPRPIT